MFERASAFLGGSEAHRCRGLARAAAVLAGLLLAMDALSYDQVGAWCFAAPPLIAAAALLSLCGRRGEG